MTNNRTLPFFSAAYLIAGAVLWAGDAISHGGSYCGVVGMIFLTVGILLSLWKPLKKTFAFIFQSQTNS
jgi:hypothetical protein